MSNDLFESDLRANGLTADGLSEEQLLHFSEHGWVVAEAVLDDARCQRYIDKIDRAVAELRVRRSDQLTQISAPEHYDPFFLEHLKIPGRLEANRQLIGSLRIRFSSQVIHITEPHPDRRTRRDELLELADLDTNREWHRCFRPRWAITRSDEDPRMHNSILVGNALFLTPVAPENGATRFLDGSHLVDGDFSKMDIAELKERCPVVQPTAPAGSIVMWSEATIHSAVHVVSEQTRYGLFAFMSASWVGSSSQDLPPAYVERLADDELRNVVHPAFAADLCEKFHRDGWDGVAHPTNAVG